MVEPPKCFFGIPLWEELLLRGKPRIPNHRLIISWFPNLIQMSIAFEVGVPHCWSGAMPELCWCNSRSGRSGSLAISVRFFGSSHLCGMIQKHLVSRFINKQRAVRVYNFITLDVRIFCWFQLVWMGGSSGFQPGWNMVRSSPCPTAWWRCREAQVMLKLIGFKESGGSWRLRFCKVLFAWFLRF